MHCLKEIYLGGTLKSIYILIYNNVRPQCKFYICVLIGLLYPARLLYLKQLRINNHASSIEKRPTTMRAPVLSVCCFQGKRLMMVRSVMLVASQ